MAASLVANKMRCGGRKEKQKGIMQGWAEMVSRCGVDCGFVQQLWHRVVLRKWLNIGSGLGDSDFSADECETSEGELYDEDMEHRTYDEERRLGGLGAGTIGDQMKSVPYRLRRCKSETLHAQYVDIRELRICVGTWNVGGKFPPSDLDIQEWLDNEEKADIYVLGFQEIVPLNAGNIFGAEDNRPVALWEHIIRETLNKIRRNKPQNKCHSDPPSTSWFNPSDYVMVMEDELLSEPDSENYGELHRLIEYNTDIVNNNNGVHDKTYKNSSSDSSERVHKGKDLDRMASIRTYDQSHNFSYEKVISNLEETTNPKKLTKMLGHSGRTGIIWPEQPLDMMAQRLQASTSFTSLKAPSTQISLKSTHTSFNYFPNDDLAHDVNSDNRVIKSNMPYFVRILSKQMVGIYLSVWVWRDLQKHIQNLRVSTVGVGAMGYMGNKGSISVSMSIHQTNFCFVCCHLTSGKKDGDELKRNADVEEILRRTVFNPLPGVIMPKRILDHERIVWLGDLNYRINLSYERTHKLIAKQDWDGLFEKDQLKRELREGRTFDGWIEGVISFPPTYKYEFNSEKYVSDEQSGRTPAWCDRILSRGKGIRLISYKRVELNLSDHRPVAAIYMAEVEVFCHKKFQRALT